MTSAREVAAQVLTRVEKESAFASAALEAELSRAVQLEPRDRALATELVYGTLRVLPWLEHEIGQFAPRGTKKLDARVRAHLVIAAYQLVFTRVPAFAAVNEAVDAVRAARGERLAAFANAVLRKVASRAAALGDAEREQAVFSSAPDWLREALARSLGPEAARAFLRGGLEPPPSALRLREATTRDAWLKALRLAAPNASFEPGRVSSLAILVRGAGKPQRLPGFDEGAWSVQEEGSQLAALAVGAQRGETVLDACAGRGNKTAILAHAVGPTGAVDACDSIPTKLDRLRQELAREGLSPRATFAVDWSAGSGEVTAQYDRVLVDAPCSGVGTLRRRPEIGLRRVEADLSAMSLTQKKLAVRAADHVRPGGSLVYVVCSVLREEAEDVVTALVQARPDLVPTPFDSAEARAIASNESSFRLSPAVHGTDGYFVARFVRHSGGR